ncbi:hypothetical protein R1sor_008114 [Riccia sorocarpa]|uniref:Uncharacterized protein n=1 Tax=Riccia sorocarpa TaxID=122646 RepID=A0ABD3HST4_9MARC
MNYDPTNYKLVNPSHNTYEPRNIPGVESNNVAEATNAIWRLHNDLNHSDLVVLAGAPVSYRIDEESLVVSIELGAEGQTTERLLKDTPALDRPRINEAS